MTKKYEWTRQNVQGMVNDYNVDCLKSKYERKIVSGEGCDAGRKQIAKGKSSQLSELINRAKRMDTSIDFVDTR